MSSNIMNFKRLCFHLSRSIVSEVHGISYTKRLREKRNIVRSFSSDSNYRKSTTHNLDMLGTWDNRISLPILLKTSIKLGKLVPKILLKNCGQHTVLGRRNTNEDRLWWVFWSLSFGVIAVELFILFIFSA